MFFLFEGCSEKCTKDGGSRRRMFFERDVAVVNELSRREQEEAGDTRAREESNRLER